VKSVLLRRWSSASMILPKWVTSISHDPNLTPAQKLLEGPTPQRPRARGFVLVGKPSPSPQFRIGADWPVIRP
jgi:hypothetical protein